MPVGREERKGLETFMEQHTSDQQGFDASSDDIFEKHCTLCGAKLTRDEIGLYKKLVNRGATTFHCKTCLCEEFHMTPKQADDMIANFRAQGCVLFC